MSSTVCIENYVALGGAIELNLYRSGRPNHDDTEYFVAAPTDNENFAIIDHLTGRRNSILNDEEAKKAFADWRIDYICRNYPDLADQILPD